MSSPLYEKLLPPPDHEVDTDSDFPSEFETGEAPHDDPFRPSQEPTDHDRAILQEEIDRENLLTRPKPGTRIEKIFHKVLQEGPEEKRRMQMEREETRRRERRLQRKRRKDEEKELMYEMEEGANRNSSTESLSILGDRMPKKGPTTASRLRRLACLVLIPVVIFGLFSVLVYGAYKMSGLSNAIVPLALLSNGTAMFAPTTILISLDGFRADFLDRGLTPTLNQFINEGVSPKYMMPSFPSVTFPNHYTLVTGLYPESHGMVGNTFWDPNIQEEFDYKSGEHSMQPKWWSGGEPIWTTAEKQGIRTAVHMWPGSEAHIQVEPLFVDKYNGTESLTRKVDRIFEFLDQPSKHDPHTTATISRPQLIAAYVPNVDADGHLYGPNSTEIRQTISAVDTMLHDLFVGLEARNLSSVVNIIVVSDHGMATTSTDRLIQLEDLIDTSLISHIDGWPLYGLRPKNHSDLESMYDTLSAAASQSEGTFEVYLRDKNMPLRYHFSNNERIAPLWLVPKTGWAIVRKVDFDVELGRKNGAVYHPRGLHGYDHEHPLMRAIFIARGPAFPHQPGSRIENFRESSLIFFTSALPFASARSSH